MTEVLGMELILNLRDCDIKTFDKKLVKRFIKDLCKLINMERIKLFEWDYTGENAEEHLKGLSLCQFIKTSDIVIHTWDAHKKVSINLFSCKDFDRNLAEDFCCNYFKGKSFNPCYIERG
jgi:S-adenosylmethionine/arginine decarboxylase-like enzyme